MAVHGDAAVREEVEMSGWQGALRPGDDPRTQARLLSRVRETALAGSTPPAAPRPVISASWRRVRGGGLDPAGPSDTPILGAAELQQRRAASGLEPLVPLLRERLLPMATATGQIMVIVDADGRVLWREGEPGTRRRADALGFVDGSAWDEGSVGTNAIGTSLVVGAPVQVFAGEHYSESHQPWTCAAAPLHDPITGRLLGAVDLSGPALTVHASTVALVDAVARLAELEIRVAHEQHLERLRALAAPVLARMSGPALVVSPEGSVAAATGLIVSGRVALPDDVRSGVIWLPALGRCIAENLPGGWLLRVAESAPAADPATLTLRLDRDPAQVVVTGAGGTWCHTLTRRHAEIMLSLVRNPGGRSAAQLADDLFGEPGKTVTARAEMSRLRRTLGPLLQSQPYRIAEQVLVTLLLPPGEAAILPTSSAPAVTELRNRPHLSAG